MKQISNQSHAVFAFNRDGSGYRQRSCKDTDPITKYKGSNVSEQIGMTQKASR